MIERDENNCPDCSEISRRSFIKAAASGVVGASIAGTAISSLSVTSRALGADSDKSSALSSETLVAQLFKSMKPEQKKGITFPFDHQLRSAVNNNWMITPRKIKDIFTKDQQAVIRDIFIGMHSEEYAPKVIKQVEQDNEDDGGLGGCAVAFFGEPGEVGKSKFEFVLTGRHVTRRCDGNSVAGAAFGGPIFYGHAADGFNERPNHPGSAYWYQGLRANEVFKALDGKQQKLALLNSKSRGEHASATVKLTGKKKGLPGIPMTELSDDQKTLVRKTLADLLAPFRKEDADEALKLIEDAGFDALHMAFYTEQDLGNDKVWDIWQIEGPSMLVYYRGAPHVHGWIHVREKAEG